MVDAQVILLIALLLAVIPLVALAKRIDISYPIVLVAGGLVLGFVPNLPAVRLDPDLVFLIFLPPLLYWGAIVAPTDVMRQNARQIAMLAFGLVLATTLAVALLVHAIVPGMPWAAAFVLGAIISPTDELAAAPVLEYFRLPRHVSAIVGGESLLNDATALVIYGTAIGAAMTGAYRLVHALAGFVVIVIGSVGVGYAAGLVAVALWRRVRDAQLQAVISVVLPFLAYVPAQHLGLSGVLAVVTAGVYANHCTPRVMMPAARRQVVGFWETVVFIANATLFLVVGLQLHDVAHAVFQRTSWLPVIGYALAVNGAVILVRLVLVVAAEYVPVAAPADHAAPDWKHALIVAWSGLRGAVSLAAALAIPLALPDGTRFPHRDLIVFLTFSVILVTLVGGGLTLPSVVRRLHLGGGTEVQDEVRLGTVRGAEAALQRIEELERDGRLDAAHAETMRARFEHRLAMESSGEERGEHAARHADAEREVIAAQRAAIIALRERGEIDNVALRQLQSELDLRSARPES